MGGNEDRRSTVEDFSTSPRNMKDWVIGEESSGRSHQGHYPMKCLKSFLIKISFLFKPILRFSTWPFLCSAPASRGELGRSIEPGQFYYWTWMSIFDFLISYFSFHGHLFQSKYQVWFHIPPSLERRIEAHLSLNSGLKVAKVVGLALWETLHQQLCDLNLYFCFAFAFVKIWLSMLIWWEFW